MHYVIPDIHNDNRRFRDLLRKTDFSKDDQLILLGDLFDRGAYDPDPVGVYFSILGIESQCTIVSGNHDRWLAEYIRRYFGTKERKRNSLPSYYYNSFDLMIKRLPEADMLSLAEWILKMPVQVTAEINDQKMLFAHAATSKPDNEFDDYYYLMGEGVDDSFYHFGIDGYISFCAHTNTSFFSRYGGKYMDDAQNSIWVNDAGNLYMMDCGCGYLDGRLACICLENMHTFYL